MLYCAVRYYNGKSGVTHLTLVTNYKIESGVRQRFKRFNQRQNFTEQGFYKIWLKFLKKANVKSSSWTLKAAKDLEVERVHHFGAQAEHL